MKNKRILFRADSSSKIGTGHIMRDLVLAKKYENHTVTFATQNLDGNINQKIINSGYKIHTLKSNKINELTKLIKKLSINLLILDIYSINHKDELKIKKKTGVTILSFADTYEKHHCDILLNHNIYAKKSKYKNLVPKNCELRCGAKYTLLRDEFKKEKKKNKIQHKKFNIFLAMGGADTTQLNIHILQALKKIDGIKVFVVTTTANKGLKKIKKYSKKRKWIKLYINSTKIAKLMRKSDLAIVTPSVILNEVFFMNLPFIAIKTANNQDEMFRYVKKINK